MKGRTTAGIGFPWLLAGAVCAWMAVLVLSGCTQDAADEAGESRYERTSVAGRVDPGAGSTLVVQDLTVRTSAGSARVDRDGKVSTPIFAEGPQYAELLDGSGQPVMLAFTSHAEPDFSALSTAKALGYLALAGPWLREEGRLKLLDEVDNVAGFLPLLAAVQAQLLQGRLEPGDAAIRSALASMATAVRQPGPSGVDRIVKPFGVIAEPTTASGLSLDTTVDSKLSVQNVYLRRVSLLFRRLSYVTAAGEEKTETNPFTRIDMPLVARYAGIVGTLEGFFEGNVAYSPVSTDPPLDIPRYPADARSTTYQVYAIGPAFSFRQNLAVPADVLAEQEKLEMKAFFLDVFVVMVVNVALPLKGDQIDEYLKFVGGNSILLDFISTMKGTVPDVWDAMQAGKWGEAAKILGRSTVTSNTILPMLGELTLDFLSRTSVSDGTYERITGGMKSMLDMMGKIDVGLNALDTGLLTRDMANSKKVEQFLVKTTPGKVTLQAAAAKLKPTETTTINATIQDKDPAGIYEYHWSVSPNANYWVEDRALNGTDDSPNGVLVTRESQVNIRSLVNTDGLASVTCKVFRVDGSRQETGEGNISITFEMTLEPYEVPSSVSTKVTSSITLVDGRGQPQREYAFVTTLVSFNVTANTSYRLLENGVDHGYVLSASDIARGAPVFNPLINYGTGTVWPAPYRGNWHNLGSGMAGFTYGSWTVVANLGDYRREGDPTLGEAIATEVARQQALVAKARPKVFIIPR